MQDDAEIVRQANELAQIFYSAHRYEVPEGYRFDKAAHPQEQGMWKLAAHAFMYLRGIDIDEAADNLEVEA